MRSRNGSNGKQYFEARWAVGALWIAIGSPSPGALAQATPDSGWRSGVSRWNGNGYVMPGTVTPPVSEPAPWTPVLPAEPSAPYISESPYTIPVDPTQSPSATGITNLGPATQTNPFFQLPPSDAATSLELTSPSDLRESGTTSGFVLPPEPPLGSNDAIVEPAPLARTELGDQPLPAPAEVPTRGVKQSPLPKAGEPVIEGSIPANDADLPAAESIAEQIEAEPEMETAPLESEVVRWYQYPRHWMRGWNSHAEFGLDGSTGNAQTLALQTGLETKRQTDKETWALDVDYRQASNRNTTIEDNGRFNLDYDRLLLDTPWAGFSKFGMEWDKFKAFDLRLWGNAGLAYHWIRRSDAALVTRFGAGASKEFGAPIDDWIPEAVFGGEAERQITPRQKLKAKVEYFPAWEDFGNFRLVNDAAWEILLDGSDNLSLKLAVTDRYDSTPQGAKKNDLYYSLLLLYKF